MRNNPNTVNLHNQVVADAAYLAGVDELHHALLVRKDLQRDDGAAFAVAMYGEVLDVVGHALYVGCSLGWIVPLEVAAFELVAEVFGEGADELPGKCRLVLH